jgi:hypothetical protein
MMMTILTGMAMALALITGITFLITGNDFKTVMKELVIPCMAIAIPVATIICFLFG